MHLPNSSRGRNRRQRERMVATSFPPNENWIAFDVATGMPTHEWQLVYKNTTCTSVIHVNHRVRNNCCINSLVPTPSNIFQHYCEKNWDAWSTCWRNWMRLHCSAFSTMQRRMYVAVLDAADESIPMRIVAIDILPLATFSIQLSLSMKNDTALCSRSSLCAIHKYSTTTTTRRHVHLCVGENMEQCNRVSNHIRLCQQIDQAFPISIYGSYFLAQKVMFYHSATSFNSLLVLSTCTSSKIWSVECSWMSAGSLYAIIL